MLMTYSISTFADDAKIYTTIQEIADSYRLQADSTSINYNLSTILIVKKILVYVTGSDKIE